MINCNVNCLYSRQQDFKMLSLTFAKMIVEQTLVVAGVQAVVSAIIGTPPSHFGTLYGGAVVVALNGIHLLSHQFAGNREGNMARVAKFALFFFTTIYVFPWVARQWEYEICFNQAVMSSILSYVGIHLYNRLHIEKTHG